MIREFVAMAEEDLLAVEGHLVDLERSPDDSKLLSRVQRRLQTLHGTCAAVGLPNLQRLLQHAQRVIFGVSETRTFAKADADAMFAWVDAVRAALRHLADKEEEAEIPPGLLPPVADHLDPAVTEPAPATRTRLVYWSRPTWALSAEEVTHLVATSTAANRAASITGSVIRGPARYIGLLEGERAAVSDTFARVARDRRHQRVVLAAVHETERPPLTPRPLAWLEAAEVPDVDRLSAREVLAWLERASSRAAPS